MREAHSVGVRQHHAPLIAGLVVVLSSEAKQRRPTSAAAAMKKDGNPLHLTEARPEEIGKKATNK